jgi:ubiquinone/menaquinone biosynthesis C-methylase UbiE
MSWKNAQILESEFWESMARGQASPPGLLEHLGDLASALNFVNLDKLSADANKLLEIGIGPLGIGSAAIHFPNLEIIGLDPLPKLSFTVRDDLLDQYVQQLIGRVQYVQSPGEKLPFRDGEFDIVVSSNCIDHCKTPMLILEEAVRVLRRGGAFLLTVNTFSQIGRTKFELERRYRPMTVHSMHPWSFTHRQILTMVAALGLEVISHQGYRNSLVGRMRLSRFFLVKKQAY